jgi:hypothetical protein
VGITNNLARRQLEHLGSKGIRIEPIRGLLSVERQLGRSIEEYYIRTLGMQKEGGLLENARHEMIRGYSEAEAIEALEATGAPLNPYDLIEIEVGIPEL